jgi:hypothetical protein
MATVAARATLKTPLSYCCARSFPLLRNGFRNHFVIFLHACELQALPGKGRCLQSSLSNGLIR